MIAMCMSGRLCNMYTRLESTLRTFSCWGDKSSSLTGGKSASGRRMVRSLRKRNKLLEGKK